MEEIVAKGQDLFALFGVRIIVPFGEWEKNPRLQVKTLVRLSTKTDSRGQVIKRNFIKMIFSRPLGPLNPWPLKLPALAGSSLLCT